MNGRPWYLSRRSLLSGGSIFALGLGSGVGVDQLVRHGHTQRTDDIVSVLGIGHQPSDVSPGETVHANVGFTNESTEDWTVSVNYDIVSPDGGAYLDPDANIRQHLNPDEHLEHRYDVTIPESAPTGTYQGIASVVWTRGALDQDPSANANNIHKQSITGQFDVTGSANTQVASANVGTNAIGIPGTNLVLTGEWLDLFVDTIFHPSEWYHGSTKGFEQAARDIVASVGETLKTGIALLTHPNQIVPVIQQAVKRLCSTPLRDLTQALERLQQDLNQKMQADAPASYGTNQFNAFDFGWNTGYLLCHLLVAAAVTYGSAKIAGAAASLVQSSSYITGTTESLLTAALTSGGMTSIIKSYGARQFRDIISEVYEPKAMFQARAFMDHVDEKVGGVSIGVGKEDKGTFAEYLRAADLTTGEGLPKLIPVYELTDKLDQGKYVVTQFDFRTPQGHSAGEFDVILVDVPYDNPDPGDVEIIELDAVSLTRTVDAAEGKLKSGLDRIIQEGVHLPKEVEQKLDGDFLLTREHFKDVRNDRSKWGIVGPKNSGTPLELPHTYDELDAIWEYHKQVEQVLDPSDADK